MICKPSSRIRLPGRQLWADRRGVVAIEFALWSTLFFVMVCGALDFGMLYLERGKLNEAVSGAAVSAFATADEVDFDILPTYVRALADDADLSVSATCNGSAAPCTNEDRTCACLGEDGSFAATACGDPCGGDGTKAGYYLTINASDTFQPMIVPRGMLNGAVVSQHATVRLQ